MKESSEGLLLRYVIISIGSYSQSNYQIQN